MRISNTKTRRVARPSLLLWSVVVVVVLCFAGSSSSSLFRPLVAAAAADAGMAESNDATTTDGGTDDGSGIIDDDDGFFDEDELVRETIAAGRGDREEQGIRDQWLSDEHLGKESVFDSRKPVSPKVQRYLDAFRLECEGCDDSEATRRVNEHIRAQKEEREARDRRASLVRRIAVALVVAGSTLVAYLYRGELEGFLQQQSGGRVVSPELARERQAEAAAKRLRQQQQQQQGNGEKPPPPTWLDNEKKEIWTPKQEKQFQKALREFSGIPKKERYKLIAEKVHGKSRIECLTHHRMQELLEKHNQQ